MSAKKILITAIALLAGSALLASATAASASAATVKPTDYSSRAHWLHLPTKSVKRVDVFYVYPSAYSRTDTSQPIFCAVNDAGMMKGAQESYTQQAWAFRTFANIYAPYYRQIDATYQLSLSAKQQEKNIQGPPAIDVFAAFKHFIKHYNHGRPYILVGHSQGSAVLRYLLSAYMKTHPRVYKRMIVAYIVGQSITPGYLAKNPNLKFAKGANDTGVVVSWNTEAPNFDGTNPVLLPGGIAINPITWTRTQTEAKAAQNPGSIQLDPNTGTPMRNTQGRILRVMNLADARVDKKKGVAICSTVNVTEPPYFNAHAMGVLHKFDYPLYFFSVRANAANRTERFFASHQGFR